MGGRLSCTPAAELPMKVQKDEISWHLQKRPYLALMQPMKKSPPSDDMLDQRPSWRWCCRQCKARPLAVLVGSALGMLTLGLTTYCFSQMPVGPDVREAYLLPPGYCQEAALPVPQLSNHSDAGISAWARDLVSRMTSEEKRRLVKGVGWSDSLELKGWYVGNILAVPRLGIPSLQMQDASQGFRTVEQEMLGQVTSWPCMLAVAAGWDVVATRQFAQAMGEEFRAKGANVVLGPGANVHRVAFNGRNAEYISGEDPALGTQLVAAYVQGMQGGAGVATVVKHFVMNDQETNRATMDALVDEQTRFEQYYPPFEAAIKEGVAAVMCSYNWVNGQQACSNHQTLNQELKGRMGFKGWVMTDWWALTNEQGPTSGADQEQPGSGQPGSKSYFSTELLSSLPVGRLEDMAARILWGMARGSSVWRSSWPTCRQGCNCRQLFTNAVSTTPEHVAIARRLAANGAVLLKNEPLAPGSSTKTLPLRPGQKVAVLGSACSLGQSPGLMFSDWLASDYYVVGGSGRVLSPNMVSVLHGLQEAGVPTQPSPTEDLAAAKAALQEADVAIVCGGAKAAESFDRSSLSLDQERFIGEVQQLASQARVPLVVLALTPGAIVAPWRHNASAALALFFSGQETGNAAADVLLGVVSPSGKLPVTFPAHAWDALPPCKEQKCMYKERLRGGWHVYDGKPVAFPFGHGLSYAQFEYSVTSDWSVPSSSDKWRSLWVLVRNVGSAAGAEVAQLYVGFPREEEDRPDLVLRGFRKTRLLAPGESCELYFTLSPRDLSVWDTARHSWRLANGRFLTKIGSSSRDFRLCGAFSDEAVEPTGPC